MHKRMIAAVALAFGVSGCASMAKGAIRSMDEKPYAIPVAAKELPEISAAASAPVAAAPRVAPDAPRPAPERTNIKGAGDGSMKIDRVVITGSTKEIAHKVPDFSREQIASQLCTYRRNSGAFNPDKTIRAYNATVAAHDARIALEAGKITHKQADTIEKEREDAVKATQASGMIMGLFGVRQKKSDLPRPNQDGLVLENVDLFTFTENGKEVMAVSGTIRNTNKTRTEVPPLTLETLDQWEFILAGQSSLLPFETLEPGEARSFESRFLNPPDTTAEVYAHFAPPFEYRARRDCTGYNPTAPGAAPEEAPSVVDHRTTHSAAELNILTRAYRAEAEAAWNCRKGKDSEPPKGGMQFSALGSGERQEGFQISLSMGKPNMALMCEPAAHRMRWRDSYELAEATDEAWGTMLALEDTSRRLSTNEATQADVDRARQAQQAAYDVFRALGRKALARVGGSAPDIDVAITSSSYGYAGFDKGGLYAEVTGTLHNTGASPRQVDALMLAFVDRLEQPIQSVTLDEAVQLAPGETKTFTHRVTVGRDPVKRVTPDHPEAGWQIRVGAMSQ